MRQFRSHVVFFAASISLVLLFCRGAVAFEPHPEDVLPGASFVLPLAFERNDGQWHSDVRFVARGRSGVAVFSDAGVTLISDASPALEISFEGGSPSRVRGARSLDQVSHYFIGNDPSAWRSSVGSYASVVYPEVYPATDVVFYTADTGELEFDFLLRPGADPGRIRLRFDGLRCIEVDDLGELAVRTPGATLRMRRPLIYQPRDGRREEIAGAYRRLDARTVGFSLAEYDPTRDLVIDPVVVGYSTFLGGSGSETVFALGVDAERSVYVAGFTTSVNFPTSDGRTVPLAGGNDAFVAKLNAAGDRVLFAAFIGGSGDETASSVSIDARGDVYLSGSTSSANLPVTEAAPQRAYGGGGDAFVTKLSRDGERLLFSTYLGGTGEDSLQGMAVDGDRSIYVAGRTRSSDFPVTAGALQVSRRGPRDGWVAKLRTAPGALLFSTYIGGSDDDVMRRLAIDANGAIYVTGNTFSTDFPTTPGAFQPAFAGAGTGNQRFGDAFVAKIDPSGSSLQYSTYLGGPNGEIAGGIAVDRAGAAYVTGIAFFTGFPTTPGAYRPQPAGGQADVFVTKIAPDGERLVYSTFVGGSENEEAFAIAVDTLGNAHLVGSTVSADFPTTDGALSRTKKGLIDGFINVLTSDGAGLLYSSFIGGSAPSGGPQENAWAVAVDMGGNTYVGGQTRSTDFPVTAGALQRQYGGVDDGFVMKFRSDRARPDGELLVVPVIGSTAGALGSFFRTSFQLHNPHDDVISGTFVFHPMGRAGAADDPHLDYVLAPGETVVIGDLLSAMSQSGLGSLDLHTQTGEIPETAIRVFNDGGEAGTTGMTQETLLPRRALQPGETGVLLAPVSTVAARFNIGIRSLGDGVSLTATVRRSDGSMAAATTKTYPADFFEQRSAAEFLGTELGPSDSITLQVHSGSAVIYGASTDNITQDPSVQLATASESVEGERRVLPVVGSTGGAHGSFFRTAVQLHNAASSAISGRLVFHRQDVPGSAADPSIPYALQPHETIAWPDLLPTMGLAGLGSVDLISESGPLPVTVARIFNDGGARGTTGITLDQVPPRDVLRTGDEGVLIAPAEAEKARFNIGLRTLEEGATITMTIRTAAGRVVRTITRTFAPIFFTQLAATALLETELGDSYTVRFRIDSGSAIIYGAITDNITQDPSAKMMRRLTERDH
jgi:hypothetical protein